MTSKATSPHESFLGWCAPRGRGKASPPRITSDRPRVNETRYVPGSRSYRANGQKTGISSIEKTKTIIVSGSPTRAKSKNL